MSEDIAEDVNEEEKSLQEEVEAALDGHDNESAGDGDPISDGSAPDSLPGQEEESAPGEEGGAKSQEGAESQEDAKVASPVEKAPVGWNAELREEWGGLPDRVKSQIHAREQQIAQAMHGTAQARQVHQEFGNLASTFGGVMSADGFNNPLEAAQNYIQVAAQLRMGTPAEKAQKIAEMINHYGVDIQTLDSTLAGETPQDPQAVQMEQMLEQKMAPVNQMMQNLAMMQQQKGLQTQQQANMEVQSFSQQAEFLPDVRYAMADMLDLATKQGRQMSMQEAYNIACQMNPQVKSVIDQRAEQERLAGVAQNTAQKRNAASSIAGQGSVSTGGKIGDSISDSLRDAWDAQLG